jgi:electron-transferring-flavoprotein dehydrogenase
MVDDPLHILIVDDEPGCRETLSLLLGTDHDVETAADGREALKELDGTVDIVLLDREMPGPPGVEVAHRTVASEFDPYVVMVSSKEMDFDIAEFPTDGYVQKPATGDDLSAIVERYRCKRACQSALDEYFGLTAKLVTLETNMTEAQLADSEEYARLMARVTEKRAEVDEALSGTDYDWAAVFETSVGGVSARVENPNAQRRAGRSEAAPPRPPRTGRQPGMDDIYHRWGRRRRMERVDVAIVGGGPAGTAAAWTAARAGADALVVEKGVPRADRDGLGPDSTDAAGMLDYWVDLMDFDPEEIPDEVVLRTLEGADFFGPSETLTIDDTGIDASCPEFGFAFHRARFDDWLREEAEHAGASYRVGDSVTGVDSDLGGDATREHVHRLSLSGGERLETEYLVLADGPQRTVTTGVLDQFTPPGRSISEHLGPAEANHIAYQEHREVPAEVYEPSRIQFWWGVMPGHTAYPWVFPNDGRVARIGLTMPIGLDIDEFDASEWALLGEDDTAIPRGSEYVRRLLGYAYPDCDIEDFPLVGDRGKEGGTETYPISSTRPVESPTAAGIAVVGGAMGGTSAFHEGGDHVAVRTGKIAGDLAARGDLRQYNDAWREALDAEFLRNVTMAHIVRGYGPDDWDRVFAAADTIVNRGEYSWLSILRSGLTGLRLVRQYNRTKRQFADGAYVQFGENEYVV